MDKEIAQYLLAILQSRASDEERTRDSRMSYQSAVSMVEYAIMDNWECLSQFDDRMEK